MTHLCLTHRHFPALVHDWNTEHSKSMAQTVKNLPAMQEIWVWSLVQVDPLEKQMATHFSILAWRIPWAEEPRGLDCMGLQSQKQPSNWHFRASLPAQLVKNPPAMQMWVQCLSQEEPLEKETATHSSMFAWEIPWTEDPGGLQSVGSQESDRT